MFLVMFFVLFSGITSDTATDFEITYNISSGINEPTCSTMGLKKIGALKPSNPNGSFGFYELSSYATIVKIKCRAPYPIDFEFEGLPAKNGELQTYFLNTIMEDNSTDTIIFHVWITYFPLQDSNPAGKYSVFSVDDATRRTSIYVFDADNEVPELFKTNIDDNEIKTIDNTNVAIIGCKTSVFNISVLLFRYNRHDGNKQLEQLGRSKFITYDPSRGFTVNITGQSHGNFTYICKCEKCKTGSHFLEFVFPVYSSVLEEQRSSTSENESLVVKINVIDGETQILCKSTFSEIPIVTNIYSENPRQLSLDKSCISKRQSYYCKEKRTTSVYGTDGTAVLRKAHSHGLAYCSDLRNKISREYFRGVDHAIYYDWNIALKSPHALLKIECQNDEKIYANINYNFTCEFVSYILSPPSFFQLEFKDGSTQIYLYQADDLYRSNEKTRQVCFTLFSNITRVSCSSLPWNSSVFVNSSIDFILLDKKRPEFNSKEESMKFMLKSTNTQLQCAASGNELPEMSWEKDGMMLNESSLEIKYEPGRSTIIFPRISHEHKGDYKCIATNSMGNASKLYHIDIEDQDEMKFGLILGLSSAVLAILIITIIASCIISRHYYKRRVFLTQEEIDEFKRGSNDPTNVPSGPYQDKYEIHSSKFQLDRSCILGSGQFGIVYKGLYNHEPVAIKTLRPYTEKIYLRELLSEIKVMIYINGHKHIVNLVGANTQSLSKGLAYAFVEFCPLGSLEGFLRKHQGSFVNQILTDGGRIEINDCDWDIMSNDHVILYTKDLILWSNQISSGMEYLAEKKVIHGDLATRNILLSHRENVKISDFGLARKLYDYAIYQKKNKVPMPWRWMAIESLQNWTFSTKTDVWAFGVTLWEIFTLANVPYPGLAWSPDFVKQLQFNMRMPQPDYANAEIYNVMRRCWEIEPNDRPTFASLNEFLSDYLKKFSPSSEYIDMCTDD